MKICTNCSYKNPNESLFCQECGERLEEIANISETWDCIYCGKEFKTKKSATAHELKCSNRSKQTKSTKVSTTSIYQKLKSNELDDVIFEPRRKDHSVLWIIISIIVILFVGLIFIASSYSEDTSNSGSQTETENTNDSSYFSDVELSYIKLNDGSMTGNSYYEPNPVYEVTLHNAGSILAKNVVLKINFYKAEDTSTDAIPADTQYLKAVDFLAPGDSTHINSIIETAFNTSGRFRWYAQVYSAEK
jgi:hypothetical protein